MPSVSQVVHSSTTKPFSSREMVMPRHRHALAGRSDAGHLAGLGAAGRPARCHLVALGDLIVHGDAAVGESVDVLLDLGLRAGRTADRLGSRRVVADVTGPDELVDDVHVARPWLLDQAPDDVL